MIPEGCKGAVPEEEEGSHHPNADFDTRSHLDTGKNWDGCHQSHDPSQTDKKTLQVFRGMNGRSIKKVY